MHPDDNTPDTIPYGYCHCGCGEKTTIAKWNNLSRGHVKGEPHMYLPGHNSIKNEPPKYKWGDTVPSGICHCGCGGTTTISPKTCISRGYVKGERIRYLHGHNSARVPIADAGGIKICSSCRIGQPVSAFYRNLATRDSYNSKCKKCCKAYRESHPEISRAHYASPTARRWRARNIDKIRLQRRVGGENRRARERASGRISSYEWQSILDRFNGKCAKCGASENIHMDHVVPLAKGGRHSVDNVQPLCQTCNLRKGVKTEDYRGKFYQPLALPLDNDT